MKMSVLLVALILLNIPVAAQIGKVHSKSEDAFSELNGKLVLHFFDALTGNPIEGGNVKIENTGNYKTDFKGRIFFNSDEMDKALTVEFNNQNYINSKFEIQITAGTIFFNRFSVSPALKVGHIRIILDWDKSPRDLDAHLIKVGDYHISYRNKHAAADGAAQLDRDDTDGFGPETITVNTVDQNANYKFFVQDYSNKGNANDTELGSSKATIKIYDSRQGLVKVISVPPNLVGDKWEVFEIVNGKILY